MLRDADDVRDRETRRARLAGVDLVHARDRAGRHPVAGLQRSRAARAQARAGSAATRTARPARRRRGRGRRSRRRRTTRTAIPRRASCASRGSSGPTIRPALLPKSATIAQGPRSLIVASGLPAVSTPTCTAVDELETPPRASTRSCPAARRDRGSSRNSASTAAKPPANTGKRVGCPARPSARCGGRSGPARRSCLKAATRVACR